MNNITLYSLFNNKGKLVNILLSLSFIFNILALITPFVTINQVLINKICYTLPGSILMMWQEGLYVVAVLILLFSILFPFVKLFSLSYIWFICKNNEKRMRLIRLIEPLGKWSMLDVFIVCIMLVLTNKQFLIDGNSEIGVIFFLLAILLSMAASHQIEMFQIQADLSTFHQDKVIKKINSVSKNHRKAIIILLIISFIALIAAIGFPYIQITDFFLSENSYSIIESFNSLLNHSTILSIFVLFTLVIFPIIHVILLIFFWSIKNKSKKFYILLNKWIELLAKLDMLDVFIFALILFMIEGKWLINTSHKTGLTMMAVFILITYFIPVIIKVLNIFPSLTYTIVHNKEKS